MAARLGQLVRDGVRGMVIEVPTNAHDFDQLGTLVDMVRKAEVAEL
jgi:hypothetical protein